MLKVFIQRDDPVSGWVQDIRDRRRMLAEVARQVQGCYPRPPYRKLINQSWRPINGCVIDQYGFNEPHRYLLFKPSISNLLQLHD